jgi:hypothetical protein
MNLTPEQVTRVKELLAHAKEGTTWNEMLERIFDQGLYQLEYRYGSEAKAARKAYSQKRQRETKVAMELYKRAQTDRELAIKLGLGKQVEV